MSLSPPPADRQTDRQTGHCEWSGAPWGARAAEAVHPNAISAISVWKQKVEVSEGGFSQPPERVVGEDDLGGGGSGVVESKTSLSVC